MEESTELSKVSSISLLCLQTIFAEIFPSIEDTRIQDRPAVTREYQWVNVTPLLVLVYCPRGGIELEN